MKTTIKDIAREANVSISTVSFALNGTAPVAEETKKRIMEAVDRLNYVPSSSARSLVTNKTYSICLHIPNPKSNIFKFMGNTLLNDMLQGIGEVIDEHNYNLLLSWDHASSSHSKIESLAKSKTVDGFLFFSPSDHIEPISYLSQNNYPFVFMGPPINNMTMNTVNVDNFEISYRNTLHLIQLGHKEIAFISPGSLDYLLSEDRYQGYKAAMQDNHIKIDHRYFYIGDTREESGYEAMRSFFSLKKPPTAVITGRDIQALGVLQYCTEFGLSIPNDLALVSFENSDIAKKHQITSISTELYQIGKEAARLLLKQIKHNKRNFHPQNIIIPSELFIRNSCGSTKPLEP
ncbi:LacI family DNA-binding transcriptional regulator [Paenibacillus sp. YYML68]|uniref:LacI family DNA-binding transcriptional regulator n=1 Tax=Paenibacillus sp. YYML68 TaxID=2909250 RepID=UPI0024908BBB|nr:LacI family DNA-binding transcriptional regulator [Paenibacillus sp. YYML68]